LDHLVICSGFYIVFFALVSATDGNTERKCRENAERRRSEGEPLEVLLSRAMMICVQLRSVDTEELEQVLKFSLAVTSR